MARHLKETGSYVVLRYQLRMALNNFVSLLKSFIVSVLKCKACLEQNLNTCVLLRICSLVMTPSHMII